MRACARSFGGRRWAGLVLLVWTLCQAVGAFGQPAHEQIPPRRHYDVIVRNGHVVDGTGSPWYSADIAIAGGRIVRIGALGDAVASSTIDAHGLTVAPGFIDMLGQSELSILADPHLPSKLFQGITTEITGEGNSAGPVNDRMKADGARSYANLGIVPDWTTLGGYFARIERQGMGINLASFVGATTVRRMVIGEADRAATPAELLEMQGLVADAMREGAVGLSTALMYAPAPYASTSELIALAGPAARAGGVYASHLRSEGEAEPAALEEALRIGREAGLPVEIWHLKAAGRASWGTMPQLVARIDAARASGQDVSANTYAYTASGNPFSAFIPPWAHDGGTKAMAARLKDPAQRARMRAAILNNDDGGTATGAWDDEWLWVAGPEGILISGTGDPALQGHTLAEIAAAEHKDPIDAALDLLAEHPTAQAILFTMSEADVAFALKQPWVSIGVDGGGSTPDGPPALRSSHPRTYGTFPHILRVYVREQHLLTLEEAIHKFTALPAAQMRLADRGVLKAGMWADIVVFDPATVADVATFANANQLSVGMADVLVNGVAVLRDGRRTDALPGKVIRGPGYSPR